MATKSEPSATRRESYSTPVTLALGAERRTHATPCKISSICILNQIYSTVAGSENREGSASESYDDFGAGRNHCAGGGGLSAGDSGAEYLDSEADSAGLLDDPANGFAC